MNRCKRWTRVAVFAEHYRRWCATTVLSFVPLAGPRGLAAQGAAVVVGNVLDGWHHAAAVADEPAYCDAMAPDAVFLATDPGERWINAEFRAWAQPQFAHKIAWDFHQRQRRTNVSADGNIAWFDEVLDTWMGTCRGSSVLAKTADGRQIEQYNVAMLIPNGRVNQVIQLLKHSGQE